MKQFMIRGDRYGRFTPLFIGGQQCPPKHTYGPAVRLCYLVHFVVSGKGEYQVGNRIFSVMAGQAFLIRPGEITTYRADESDPWHYVWVGFQAESKRVQALPYVIENERLRRAAEHLLAQMPFGAEQDAYAMAAAWEFLGALLDGVTEEPEESYAETAMELIRRDFRTEITVQSIADTLGLDRSYFSNRFKEETGRRPGEYLMEVRMEKARELLEKGKYSVTVVANSVGYADPFSFSRTFKKFFGVAPSQYKTEKEKAK